ncbi:MAG: hypothetical protein M3239_00050 [Thermoproteota archaeon]|jgi:hypothetical protein|nr:hypothetical protein [Thermoproteota archaeon]
MTTSSSTISLSLLEQADELARMRSWTRAFSLGIMYCAAEREERQKEADLCMVLLQEELKKNRGTDRC